MVIGLAFVPSALFSVVGLIGRWEAANAVALVERTPALGSGDVTGALDALRVGLRLT
jgi:hypothetical protein